jgi:hypothetical protein
LRRRRERIPGVRRARYGRRARGFHNTRDIRTEDQKAQRGADFVAHPHGGYTRARGRTKSASGAHGLCRRNAELERNAKDKLARKRLDFIAANDVTAPGVGFAGDTNAVTLYDAKGGCACSGLMQKAELADWLLDALVGEMERR